MKKCKNVLYPAFTQDTERWCSIDSNLLRGEFICLLLGGWSDFWDYTCICMFLKTNGLFLSLSRAFLIPNNTGKNVSNCISKWTHGGCLGAGGEERGCLGQEESLGEMEMYILIGEGDLQARILSKLINRCCLLY